MRTCVLALALATSLSGCANGQVLLGSGSPGGVGVQGGLSGVTTLFWLGVVAVAEGGQAEGGSAPPPLAPDRRVKEQDCSRPLEDPSANLKCR